MRHREEKGKFRSFHGPREGLDQCRDSTPLFLCPWQLSASGSIAWTSARLQNKACSRSSNHHLNIYQSIITSNSLPLFLCLSLSVTHRLNQSGTGPGRSLSPLSKNEKGCITAAGPDRQTETPAVSSLNHSSVYLSLSTPPEVLKGKVAVFTSRMLHVFFVKRREEKQRNLGPLLFSEKSLQDGSRVFICEFYRLKFIYDKLCC